MRELLDAGMPMEDAIMIGVPINDHECLGRLVQNVVASLDTAQVRDLAARFPTAEGHTYLCAAQPALSWHSAQRAVAASIILPRRPSP